LRWWLIVGWDSSNGEFKSQTHASPPSWDAMSDMSRNRTGSASALSNGATCWAWSADSGSRDNGEQQATVSTGLSTINDFDTSQY
jgi:hypothetical protein